MTFPEKITDALPPDNELVIGTVVSGNPLVVSARGGSLNGVGRLASAAIHAGDPVALLRQDATWALLGSLIPATGRGVGITNIQQATVSALFPLVAAETDVPGTTITFSTLAPNALLVALWICYYESLAASSTIGIAKLRVDGVTNVSPQAIYSPGGSATGQATTAACSLTTLAPGAHTVLLRANRVGGADGQLRIDNLHSNLLIVTLE